MTLIELIFLCVEHCDINRDLVELIERFVGKKLTFCKLNFEKMKNMFNQLQPKEIHEKSQDGKYIYTYNTVKDLEGNIVSSYFMSEHGRKSGLSDQYKIYKMKQLSNENPEYKDWKEIAQCFEKLYGLENLNAENIRKKNNNLIERDIIFDRISKDVGWN